MVAVRPRPDVFSATPYIPEEGCTGVALPWLLQVRVEPCRGGEPRGKMARILVAAIAEEADQLFEVPFILGCVSQGIWVDSPSRRRDH